MTCPVCSRPTMWADGKPCLACCQARAVAATDHRCHCTTPLRQPRTVTTPHRSWIVCDRCLGTIRSIS